MKTKKYELKIDEEMKKNMSRVAEDGNLKWSVKIRNFIQQTIEEEDKLANEIANLRKKFK